MFSPDMIIQCSLSAESDPACGTMQSLQLTFHTMKYIIHIHVGDGKISRSRQDLLRLFVDRLTLFLVEYIHEHARAREYINKVKLYT